ncbi:hypothetical protein Salat_0912800 [Sesamum alatum]|uniref:Uncharacterized protein n=1 Tax=Sesamum alatum TaxID=300844 RepID=A0AAE2CR84_9LAMI|nr:hypothetical protein Salat_0912800 [Sesamum alatum]
MAYMNGYKMDGKMLAVRVAGQKPVPGPLHLVNVPNHSSHRDVPCNALVGAVCFLLPPVTLCTNINVATTQALNFPPHVSSSSTDPRVTVYNFCDQIPTSLPKSASQFPGDPDYPGSQFYSYFNTPTMNESENQMPETDRKSSFWSTSRLP